MSCLFRAAFVGVLLLAGAHASASLSRGQQALITDANEMERIMTTVENAIWASDGSAADRPVYVVYSTECSWSRALHEQTRGLTDQLQFRWIPAGVAHADLVVSARTGSAVARAFAGQGGDVPDASAATRQIGYNRNVMQSLAWQLERYGRSRTFSYPTLVYRTDTGVRVIAGNPADLTRVAAEVARTGNSAELAPAGTTIASAAVERVASARLRHLENHTDTAYTVLYYPNEAAPPMLLVDPGYSIEVSAVVVGDEWVEVVPFGPSGPRGYVHSPVHARMANFSYDVRPASGRVQATQAPTIVRTLPLPDAPVLVEVPRGYVLPRTGEVHVDGATWDQVQALRDGTRGYIGR